MDKQEIIEEVKKWMERNEAKIKLIAEFARQGEMYKIYAGACWNQQKGVVYPCIVVANESKNRYTIFPLFKFVDVYIVLKVMGDKVYELVEELQKELPQTKRLPAEVV